MTLDSRRRELLKLASATGAMAHAGPVRLRQRTRRDT